VLREIAEVLARPKFARVLTEDRRREALELLAAAALWVEPREEVRDCRDPNDNRHLELALAAGASAILTGDEDLLVSHPWRGVQVLRPAEFLPRFEGSRSQAPMLHRAENGPCWPGTLRAEAPERFSRSAPRPHGRYRRSPLRCRHRRGDRARATARDGRRRPFTRSCAWPWPPARLKP
jgi:hypothetical protein